MHIHSIAQALQNFRAGADLVRPEMGEGQVGEVVSHCAVLEDVDPVLGPQDSLLQGLRGLVP